MFYSIHTPTPLLTEVNPGLHLDSGWEVSGNIWYKGYSTECNLSSSIDSIVNGYTPNGIWCVIQLDNQEYKIYHPRIRCFPEFRSTHGSSNLIGDVSAISKNIESTYQSEHTDAKKTAKNIADYLLDNITNFHKHNTDEVNIWCTGGVDSMSLVALYEYANIPYNIYVARPRRKFLSFRDFQGSISEQSSSLIDYVQNKHWGYSILSVFEKPTTLVTGFYGDEYMMRGPEQIKYVANSIGVDLSNMIDDSQYMSLHMTNKSSAWKNINVDHVNKLDKDRILETLTYDYQMWHLNLTKVFSPYYDPRIINEVLSLRGDVLLDHALNASTQKDIIGMCKPDVMLLLDDKKNSPQGRFNFFKNIHKVKLSSCKQIYQT